MENSQLGDLLEALRDGRSLRDISKATGISHVYLRLLEKGIDPRNGKTINPSPEVLKKLASAYNYSYEILMDAAGYTSETSNIDDNFVKRIIGLVAGANLTETDKENVLKNLETVIKIIEEGKK